jgi:hypothetical protein
MANAAISEIAKALTVREMGFVFMGDYLRYNSTLPGLKAAEVNIKSAWK